VDSGVEENAEISVYYDPMIAKLIVRAADRQQGLDRMARALREFLILGVRTSIPLHQWLMAHPSVRSGEVDTGWLEREWRSPEPSNEGTVTAAIAATLLADSRRAVAELPAVDGVASRSESAWRMAGRRAGLS
jgi:acetyl-CoA carboxylase biotin carboxylase subunit